eukprot:scaffold427483_cov33-Prasinocladus_malaysianus.AAC.1
MYPGFNSPSPFSLSMSSHVYFSANPGWTYIRAKPFYELMGTIEQPISLSDILNTTQQKKQLGPVMLVLQMAATELYSYWLIT